MDFCCKYAKRYKTKLKKIKIAEILSDKYYDFSTELNEEEQNLFDEKYFPNTHTLLFAHPMLYMIKKVLRDKT